MLVLARFIRLELFKRIRDRLGGSMTSTQGQDPIDGSSGFQRVAKGDAPNISMTTAWLDHVLRQLCHASGSIRYRR